jgi:hypothetical protein
MPRPNVYSPRGFSQSSINSPRLLAAAGSDLSTAVKGYRYVRPQKQAWEVEGIKGSFPSGNAFDPFIYEAPGYTQWTAVAVWVNMSGLPSAYLNEYIFLQMGFAKERVSGTTDIIKYIYVEVMCGIRGANDRDDYFLGRVRDIPGSGVTTLAILRPSSTGVIQFLVGNEDVTPTRGNNNDQISPKLWQKVTNTNQEFHGVKSAVELRRDDKCHAPGRFYSKYVISNVLFKRSNSDTWQNALIDYDATPGRREVQVEANQSRNLRIYDTRN